jgi:hypothetical protein
MADSVIARSIVDLMIGKDGQTGQAALVRIGYLLIAAKH